MKTLPLLLFLALVGFGWSENGNGENTNGFTALPGGHFIDNIDNAQIDYSGFYDPEESALFWTASEYDQSSAWYRVLNFSSNAVIRPANLTSAGFSVRCIKDK